MEMHRLPALAQQATNIGMIHSQDDLLRFEQGARVGGLIWQGCRKVRLEIASQNQSANIVQQAGHESGSIPSFQALSQ